MGPPKIAGVPKFLGKEKSRLLKAFVLKKTKPKGLAFLLVGVARLQRELGGTRVTNVVCVLLAKPNLAPTKRLLNKKTGFAQPVFSFGWGGKI